MSRVSPIFVAAIALVASSMVHAQQAERAVFVMRLGKDTLAVESVTFRTRDFEADLQVRTPRLHIHRRITVSPTFDLESLDISTSTGMQGDSATNHFVLTVTGDTLEMRGDAIPGASAPAQRAYLPRGSVPYTNLSGLAIELILRRARALARDTVMVPLFIAPGRSVPVRVTRVAADSASLTIGATDIRVKTDAVGRLLGAFIPSQGAYIDRLAADSPVAAWMPTTSNYDAPPGAPYVAEQLTLRTPAGITLAGTLTLPAHLVGARLPAVVLITGSGAQDRDEAVASIGAYRPFREIADTLSRRGIAVLRLDDRGVGGSSLGPITATTADFADDIRAAVAWLRARNDINPSRIGLVGHSEGGVIGPMIAATDPALRALVIVAGTARTGRAILNGQRRYEIEHSTAIAPAARDSAYAAAQHTVDSLFAAPGWWHFFSQYDPLPTARRVRTPTLILQGETDTQVTPEQASMLADAMRAGGNRDVSVRTFPRMNHLMLDDPSGDFTGYGRLPSYRVRRDFLGVLADWVARQL